MTKNVRYNRCGFCFWGARAFSARKEFWTGVLQVFLKNLKIKTKLLLLSFIPILGAVLVTALAVNNIASVSDSMRQTLYEEGIVCVRTLTNADRDLYQGLSYYQEAGRQGVSAERKAELLASFETETRQAIDRAAQAQAVVEQDHAVWGTVSHANSGSTVYDNLSAFAAGSEQWIEDAKAFLDKGWGADSFLDTDQYNEFLSIRTQLDEAQENIDGAMELQMGQIERFINRTTWTSIAIDAAVIAVTTLLAAMIISFIARPLNRTARLMDEMSEGDLSSRLDVSTRDEIGDMAASLNGFIEHLAHTMGDIRDASAHVASAADQVSSMSMSLSEGSTEQASAIEEFNASLENIASKTSQNAKDAGRANQLSSTTQERAEQGNAKMNAMLTAMSEINEASGSIFKIIKVIDDIAFKTNILALNAAVEAARAGEYGKGFAVVAQEVRDLAARSAEAARETTDMIQSSITKTAAGSAVARETAEELQEIMELVRQAAELTFAISKSSNDQAVGIDQLRIGLEQITQVVHSNSSSAVESSAASENLLAQAKLLREQVAYFRLTAE